VPQLSLVPVADQAPYGADQVKNSAPGFIDGGGDSRLSITKDYHLTSTPSFSIVDDYYHSQLAKYGWLVIRDETNPADSSSGSSLHLALSQAGHHSDTFYYLVTYIPKSPFSQYTELDLTVASSTSSSDIYQ
jgi:hypothetical protein